MPKLVISLPDAGEVIHELTAPRITIGRVEDNTIQIDDPSVSSHHAELNRSGDRYEVKDLDSTNGTRINGEPLTGAPQPVRTGDRIQFGKVEAIVESSKKQEARPLPQEERAVATPAATSQRPSDFDNASPFQSKRKARRPFDLVAILLTVLGLIAAGGAAYSVSQLLPPQF